MHSWLRKGGAQRQRSVSAVVGVEGRQDAPREQAVEELLGVGARWLAFSPDWI